jgi:hypothetical protein
MQTIEDGMIKADLVRFLRLCDVPGIAEATSLLVNRRQQRMIIDACMELADLMDPAYTSALLSLFKSCATLERTCKLVTISVRAIREAAGSTTPVDAKVAETIDALIGQAGGKSTLDVAILKGLPLKIGKKWRGVASCCVRVVRERIPQKDAEASPGLLALLQGELPAPKSRGPDAEPAVAPNAHEVKRDEVKLGILWTYTRGRAARAARHGDWEPEDKVIAYSGRAASDVGSQGQGILYLE